MTSKNSLSFTEKGDPVSIRLPKLAGLLPVKTHPETESLIAESDAWAQENLRFFYAQEHQLRKAERWHVARLACLVSPGLDRETTLFICNFFRFMTALDDELSDPGGLGGSRHAARGYVQKFMSDLVGWEREDPRLPFSGFWKRTRERLSPARWRRIVSGMDAVLSGYLNDLESLHSGGDTSSSLEEYLATRRPSVAMHVWFVLAEDALAPEVTETVANGAELMTLNNIALDYMRLCSDLFSYRKEVYAGEVINVVEFFQRAEGLSLQGAINRACETINVCEREFIERRGKLLASGQSARPGLQAYLNELGYFLSGTLRWCYLSGRYHGSEHTWDGTTSGTLTLLPDRTIFTPDAPPD